MKQRDILILIGLGAAAFLLSSYTGSNTNIDIQGLTTDQGDLARLNNVYSALQAAGLTPLQIKFCMSQILLETGILTPSANYTAMDGRNNYAGLTSTNGGYATYNSINDFVNAYIGFLTKGSDPLGASSISDFNNRLYTNGYYTDSPVTYGHNLNTYFNLLSQ